MGALALNLEDLHEPSAEEIEAARHAARALGRVSTGDREITVVADEAKAEPIKVPANVFRTFVRMLAEIGNGNTVAIVPIQAELTTQQAADLLNISRPHLIKLLERKDIPFRMVGTHRKLRAQDVLNYQSRIDLEREEALAAMAAADQALGLYDDEQVSGDR